jgi:hypothetical protein
LVLVVLEEVQLAQQQPLMEVIQHLVQLLLTVEDMVEAQQQILVLVEQVVRVEVVVMDPVLVEMLYPPQTVEQQPQVKAIMAVLVESNLTMLEVVVAVLAVWVAIVLQIMLVVQVEMAQHHHYLVPQ